MTVIRIGYRVTVCIVFIGKNRKQDVLISPGIFFPLKGKIHTTGPPPPGEPFFGIPEAQTLFYLRDLSSYRQFLPMTTEILVHPFYKSHNGKITAGSGKADSEINVGCFSLLHVNNKIHEPLFGSLRGIRDNGAEILQVVQVTKTLKNFIFAEDVTNLQGDLPEDYIVLGFRISPHNDVFNMGPSPLNDGDNVRDSFIFLIPDLLPVNDVEDVTIIVVEIGDTYKIGFQFCPVDNISNELVKQLREVIV